MRGVPIETAVSGWHHPLSCSPTLHNSLGSRIFSFSIPRPSSAISPWTPLLISDSRGQLQWTTRWYNIWRHLRRVTWWTLDWVPGWCKCRWVLARWQIERAKQEVSVNVSILSLVDALQWQESKSEICWMSNISQMGCQICNLNGTNEELIISCGWI